MDDNLDDIVKKLLPGFIINKRLDTMSGQRHIFFGTFDETIDPDKSKFGEIVVKIPKHLTQKLLLRLQKEVNILKSINSEFYPSSLFDVTFTKLPWEEKSLSQPLFITIEEKIDALPLSECMSKFDSEEKVIELVKNIISALKLLWQRAEKIVHRDLKPDNILIRSDNTPVIIDLGLVREEGSLGITSDDIPHGPCTPLYASPEQIRNEKNLISFKTDCFALGIIMYELLSSKNPFYSLNATKLEIFENILTKDPENLNSLGHCSVAMANFIEKILQKEPYKRYRTVEKLTNDLNLLV